MILPGAYLVTLTFHWAIFLWLELLELGQFGRHVGSPRWRKVHYLSGFAKNLEGFSAAYYVACSQMILFP